MTIQNITDRELALQARVTELEAENTAICTLMNSYNTGGWTDSLTLIKERDALTAENEKLSDLWSVMKATRDQLYAQIEASRKQEPVGYTDKYGSAYAIKWTGKLPPNINLYSAPVVAPDDQSKLYALIGAVERSVDKGHADSDLVEAWATYNAAMGGANAS